MRYTLVLILITITSSLTSAEEEDSRTTVEHVVKWCTEKNGIELKEVETVVKERKLPDSDNWKEFLSCVIKEIGFQQMRRLMVRS